MNIKSAQFVISNSDHHKCPNDTKHEFAFIGRSNVGKSSLINMITGQNKLAMTSATPGKTLLINHFLVNDEWYLVDLPGYGYAKRSKAQTDKLQEIIEGYILEREQMTCLFLLIDIRHKPQQIDLEFIEWLGEHGVPFVIVFTKADKLSNGAAKNNVLSYMKALETQWEELPTYFISSSLKKQGRENILSYIEQTINNLS